MDTEAKGRNIYAKFDLNSSHKHARGWLQWRAMGQKISKEDDSQYEVEVIVEKSWRLLPPTSMPVIHCLPHDSDLCSGWLQR